MLPAASAIATLILFLPPQSKLTSGLAAGTVE
jgi:hypothetical protein